MGAALWVRGPIVERCKQDAGDGDAGSAEPQGQAQLQLDQVGPQGGDLLALLGARRGDGSAADLPNQWSGQTSTISGTPTPITINESGSPSLQ